MDRSRHGHRLTAVRTLGVALGLVALVLGGVAVRAFALVAAGVQTVPFWPAARLYPPWAVLLALLGGIGLACAYGAVRLALAPGVTGDAGDGADTTTPNGAERGAGAWAAAR